MCSVWVIEKFCVGNLNLDIVTKLTKLINYYFSFVILCVLAKLVNAV